MKVRVKKNQMLITALAVMIAVAGYLNFSGRDLSVVKEGEESQEVIEQTADGSIFSKEEIEKKEQEGENAQASNDDEVSAPVKDSLEESEMATDTQIGEAVLTSANVSNYIASTKMEREQTYAKAKENLQSIIEDANVSNAQKEEAVAKKTALSDTMEKEAATEQLLGSKGFLNSIVTIQDDSVDVCVQAQELSSVQKAQIEDIVTRTADCKVSDMVISTLKIAK
ncbi:MAG: SpoIIIAH-like family protein [Lachnospiraceae bacterium]